MPKETKDQVENSNKQKDIKKSANSTNKKTSTKKTTTKKATVSKTKTDAKKATREFDTFIIPKLMQALKMLIFLSIFCFLLDVLCRSVV